MIITPVFRNYEIEYEFIRQMDAMAEMHMPFHMAAFGENVDWIGVNIFGTIPTAANLR